MENPYQSPEEPCAPVGVPPPMEPGRRPPGLVHHVRVVAILMLVQGAAELFAALGLGVMAVAIQPLAAQMAQVKVETQPPNAPSPAQFFQLITAMYGVMAAAALVAGLLHIAAGVQNCRFRGRVLGIVVLASGFLVTPLTCYCAPTGVALGVYGLIVYLNGPVSEAFYMGESGGSSRDIFTTFRR